MGVVINAFTQTNLRFPFIFPLAASPWPPTLRQERKSVYFLPFLSEGSAKISSRARTPFPPATRSDSEREVGRVHSRGVNMKTASVLVLLLFTSVHIFTAGRRTTAASPLGPVGGSDITAEGPSRLHLAPDETLSRSLNFSGGRFQTFAP